MPIYEYRCSDCGFQKEFLQRMSDAPLTDCPGCGKKTFNKMVTAAGFQLKGGGWYVTDFKNSGNKPKPDTSAGSAKEADSKTGSKSEDKSESKTETKPEGKAGAASGASATPTSG